MSHVPVIRLTMLLLLIVSPLLAVEERRPRLSVEPPMWVPSQSPLQSLHIGVLPGVPRDLAPGEISVRRSDTWTNVWIDGRPEVLLDYEVIDSRLGIDIGLPRSTQVQITFNDRIGTGGKLDPLIENFHRVIANHDSRHTMPRNRVNIEVRDPSTGEVLVSRLSLGPFSRGLDVSLSKRRSLRYGDASAAVSVRLPRRGSDAITPAGIDSAISLAWSGVIRGTRVHSGVAISRLASSYPGPIRGRRIGKTLLLAAARPTLPRTALVAQYLYNASLAESGPLASGSHEVTARARLHISETTALDGGIVENIVNFMNGPDFGFHFGITHDIKRRLRP